jgi:hypothetical protein
MNKKGKMVAKAKCVKGETPLSANNLGGFGLFGAQGTAGKDGSFNPANCQTRESDATGFSVITVTAACLVSEVAVSGGCRSTSSLAYLREANLLQGDQSHPYRENAYGLYRCIMEDWNGLSHTVTAQA